MPQSKYWQELYDLKSHSNYIEKYHRSTEHTDRVINCCLAIASSSSIGAWALWKDYAYVWALIIAASQVINAVKPFLPYKARLKALGSLSHELEELCNYAESRWYNVARGALTSDAINKLQFEVRAKKQALYKKHIGNSCLPDRQDLMSEAEDAASQHFNNYYKERQDV